MGWPYHFVSLDDEQQARRRQLLDSYGQFAQLSILLLPLLYQLGLGVRLLVRRLRWRSVYQPVKEHQSPVASGFEQATIGGKGNLWARIRWVLDAQVAKGWGTKKEWLAVVVWGSWLLLLVLKDTGDGESRYAVLDSPHSSRKFFHCFICLPSQSLLGYDFFLLVLNRTCYYRSMADLHS